jgi:Tfp pilus assembly protein PilF
MPVGRFLMRSVFIPCASLVVVLGTAGAVSATPADPAGCLRGLAALDARGQVVFETVALLTGRPGLAAAPLHPLERGGVRWSRLILRPPVGGTGLSVDAVSVRPDQDLALLRVDAAAVCAAAPPDEASPPGGIRPPPATGSAVRLFRERSGFRSGSIGGRVERVIDLADGGRIALLHLLDDGGSDPGLVVDEVGRFLGVTIPAPAGGDPSLAALVLAPSTTMTGDGAGGGWSAARDAIEARPSPALLATTAGLVGQALLMRGSEGRARGIALLSAAIAQRGDLASVRLERGVLEFGAGELPAAIADFERAASLDPSSSVARFNLGVSLGAAGRYAEAADAFRQARDLDPSHPTTHYQLALSLKVLRREAEARREFEALQALDPALATDLKAILGL